MHPGTCLNTPLLPPLRHASSNCVPLYLRFNLRCPVFALPFQLHSTKSTVSPFHPPSPSFPSSVQVKGSQSTCLLAAPSHQTAQRRQRRNTTKPPDSATSKTKCWMRETHQPMNSICMALSQLHSSFPDVLFGRPHRACQMQTAQDQQLRLSLDQALRMMGIPTSDHLHQPTTRASDHRGPLEHAQWHSTASHHEKKPTLQVVEGQRTEKTGNNWTERESNTKDRCSAHHPRTPSISASISCVFGRSVPCCILLTSIGSSVMG